MSITYGFYNSENGDRTYDAEQFGSLFDGIITDGVFKAIEDALKVVPNTNEFGVNVGLGKAWFNHTWTLNDSILVLNPDASEVLYNRIDAVILEVNASNDARKNDIKIVKGIGAASPKKPAMINTGKIHQYPLAYVTIRANAETIEDSDIENVIGTDECPWVQSPVYEANNTQIENLVTKVNNIKEELGNQVVYEYDEATATLNIITMN